MNTTAASGAAGMMKSWQAREFGEPSQVLRLYERPIPSPTEHMVTVKVRAAGVGLPDLMMLQGRYPLVKKPPVSPGQEMVGDVVASGPGSKFSVGDRVMGMALYDRGFGAFSEYCLMEDHRGCLAPEQLSDEAAAGFLIPFNTAYSSLVTRGSLRKGETLLVLGASGSSGAAAVQLGKCLGATVIAVAGGVDKLRFCREQGADHCLNYRQGDLVEKINMLTDGRGVDVVFDPVGGKLSEMTVGCIARHGRICLVGFASGAWPRFDPLEMVLRNFSVVGVFARGLSEKEASDSRAHGLKPAESQRGYRMLCSMVENGELHTPVAQVFPFTDPTSALNALAAQTAVGKLVVRIT